ncbi:MAG: hypothetical protein WB767_12615 [Nocardioides sp.]
MLTQVFGYSDALYDVSFVLAMSFGLVILLGWFALFVTLIADRGDEASVSEASAG